MRNLIKKIAHFISTSNNYSIEQEEKVEYSMRIFIFETLKIILLIVFFSLLKLNFEAFIVILVMSTTKPFIGGYHEDTQIKCFIATLLIVGSIIYLSFNNSFNIVSVIIISAICLFSIWHRAPVVNPEMAITKEKLLKRNRTIGFIISLLYALAAILLLNYNVISNLIIWTLVFQCLLLFNKRTKRFKT
ncbi:accessory gene regulator ArgB-like protein [Clostridium sp. DL1XJH146]